MSVTQDYKILTLTRGEFLAVQFALEDRRTRLSRMLDKPDEIPAGPIALLLADVQSALLKVTE
ncbi:hypothetical protein [Pseudoduganella namucuonensis]|uniref:Uncharacterized protein n=1 Tax=Pseudoduganella namucuonensis TaxID=1035707 RepID=A0A1I7KQ02_9BURK|nr:hypothetical protein [Pseudoduganella namucuonensis]SFU99522.1 hypothetical protein SAMN05216552_1018121 [Pseudoduganella namucuonensis]